MNKFKIKIPIIIPSYYRKSMTLIKCLDSIYRFYEPSDINVVLQKYPIDIYIKLKENYPLVNFIYIPEGFKNGIIDAFQYCHNYMSSKYYYYAFIEDDITMIKKNGKFYPTLLAFEKIFENNKNIGIIGSRFIGLQFKDEPDFYKSIGFVGNPAHCVGYLSEVTKQIIVDEKFKDFRTDTDITLQIISLGYGLLFFKKRFTYFHLSPISKIENNKFILIDKNENSTNDRTKDLQKNIDKLFAEKWKLKINKTGRVLYEQYIKKNNILINDSKQKEIKYSNINKLYEGI